MNKHSYRLSAARPKNFIAFQLFFFTLAGMAAAQVASLGNSSVSGAFYFRHLQITTDPQGNASDSRAAAGTITFNGAGRYSVNAQLSVGTLAPTSLTGSGAYSVGASGAMSIGNPLRNSLSINARLGTEAIVGSTTESGDNVFDLFVAIPAGQTQSAFSGSYYVASLDLPFGNSSMVRNAFLTLTPNGSGGFSPVSLRGHALNVNGGQVATQGLTNPIYTLSGGTGTMSFGASNSNLSGNKYFYLSASGNIFIGGALDGTSQDLVIGVRAFSGTRALSAWSGLFYTGGLRFDAQNPTTASYVGAWNALPGPARASTYQREHQLGYLTVDYTSFQNTALNSDGTFLNGTFNLLGLGSSGNSFVTADVASIYDNKGFSLDFGTAVPSFGGSAPYLSPVGVVSAASFSPTGGAIAPGQFISLFGAGFTASASSASAPFPLSLGGVTVTVNGTVAALNAVSPSQINAIVPYSVTGSFATVIVSTGGQVSNSVTVPLAPTAPGVFTQDGTGTGFGSILHANGSLVTTANPAKKGEIVQIYLTGLGTVKPPVPDGAAGGSALSNADARVAVLIAGQPTALAYAGVAPGFPGVYQINITVPANLIGSGALPVLIQTVEGLGENVDIAVQ